MARLGVAGLPRCQVTELTASLTGRNGLTGGTLVDWIVLRNVGDRPCYLDGTPTVVPLDAKGAVVPHHTVVIDGFFGRETPTALAAGHRDDRMGQATIPMSFSVLDDQGNACPAGRETPIASFEVMLAGSGTLSVKTSSDSALAPCNGRMRTGGITPPQ